MAIIAVSFVSESSDHFLIVSIGGLPEVKEEIEKLHEELDYLYVQNVVVKDSDMDPREVEDFINGGC
jgi:hypothetical protein